MKIEIEKQFADEVGKRRRQRRQRQLIKLGLSLWMIFLAVAIAVLWFWGNPSLSLGSLDIPAIMLVAAVMGFSLSLILWRYRWLQRIRRREPQLGQAKSDRPNRWKPFVWFGVGLLVVAVIYQARTPNSSSSTDNLLTRLLYQPAPPQVTSPWPWPEQNQLHPAIAAMPAEAEASIRTVADYIARQESDPYLRVKAIHDYVISRLTYDLEVLKSGTRPSQEAHAVFKSHKAVCEGYANLFAELGRSLGLEVVYLRGNIRRDLAPLDLIPSALRLIQSNYDWTRHAWNAVRVDNNWQLVDTTWDDSTTDDPDQAYSSDYLMLPPEAMIASHFPEQADWQLLAAISDRQQFEASPILRPQLFAEGLQLIEPQTYETQVPFSSISDTPHIQVKTGPDYPRELVAIFARAEADSPWLPNLANFFELANDNQGSDDASQKPQACESLSLKGDIVPIVCPFPEPGNYEVMVFSLGQEHHDLLAQLKFQAN